VTDDDEREQIEAKLPENRKGRRKLYFGKNVEKPLRSRVQRTSRKKRSGGTK